MSLVTSNLKFWSETFVILSCLLPREVAKLAILSVRLLILIPYGASEVQSHPWTWPVCCPCTNCKQERNLQSSLQADISCIQWRYVSYTWSVGLMVVGLVVIIKKRAWICNALCFVFNWHTLDVLIIVSSFAGIQRLHAWRKHIRMLTSSGSVFYCMTNASIKHPHSDGPK